MLELTSQRIIRSIKLASFLGWQDVRQAYRRSVIGPFWITAGMAVQIGAMAIVFGMIFKAEMINFLPFIATSIILWSLIAGILSEGCMSFIGAEAIIRQLNLSMATHVLRVIWKNIVTFGHNVVILPLAFLIVFRGLEPCALFALPGLSLLVLNLSWMAMLLGLLSARYRDLPPIVSSLLTIALYVTPVMWYPSLIGNNAVAHFLLGLNPFYHLIQIVRLPLLGEFPTIENWSVSITLFVLGWAAVLVFFRKFGKSIAYWV